MLAIRRRVTGFAKRRYPGDLEDRQIRGPIEEWVNMLPAGALWLALSPLVLFQQALPEEEGEHVVVPA